MHGGRFGAGDGLRALAALAVVAFHASVVASVSAGHRADGPGWWLAGHLDLGLYVFFVLSGYLVTRSLLRAPGFRTFAVHRVRRIVPAFWAALLLTLAVAGAGGADVAGAFGFAGTWPTISQAWTLDAELGFYLALPPAAALAALALRGRSPTTRAVALLSGLAAIAALSLVVRQAAGPVGHPLPAVAFAFAPGVALAGGGAARERAPAPRSRGGPGAERRRRGPAGAGGAGVDCGRRRALRAGRAAVHAMAHRSGSPSTRRTRRARSRRVR
jgi:peptidoglycan/LPS O-acetylase OafA/YrhL